MKNFASAVKGAINNAIDAAVDVAEGAIAVTTEAVNNGAEAVRKVAADNASTIDAAKGAAKAGVDAAKAAVVTGAAVVQGAVDGAVKAATDRKPEDK